MCRILYMETKTAVKPQAILKSFAEMARNSEEYQGHGWGCAWWANDHWDCYWSIHPVWEDNFQSIPSVKRLLVHARSAFRDQGIAIENNMPFVHQQTAFVFNGELHGVRIKEKGRIGAEKIFNFILRFKKENLMQAVQRALPVIQKRSTYIRALNFFLADASQTVMVTLFNEQAAYFTLYQHQSADQRLICSAPLSLFSNWKPIPNQTTEVISL